MNAITRTPDPALLQQLLGKAYEEIAAGYAGILIGIGAELGLYAAMAGAGPLTSEEVAHRAGCAERYVREWLNAQAAGGYVAYHPTSRTYELTAEQTCMLADPDGPANITPAWQLIGALFESRQKAIHAFRTGEGIAWGDQDPRVVGGCASFYHNVYRASLLPEWLPALDGVAAKLEAGAHVADVGCGYGHSTRIMAQAFPASTFVGVDSHEGSIAEARGFAERDGLSGRVTFQTGKAAQLADGAFDLICFFDCLHDLGYPVDAARAARQALKPDGTLLLVEPAAGDRVEDNFNTVGRLFYAGSTMLCCAHAISEQGTHVLGAQAGEARLASICREAGFSQVRVAARTAFNMLIEARP